jgi:hypothetical protein
VAPLLAIGIQWGCAREHTMAVSSIGAATSAVSKAISAKPAPPPAAASTQTTPATNHKKHHPQVGQQGHQVNKLV